MPFGMGSSPGEALMRRDRRGEGQHVLQIAQLALQRSLQGNLLVIVTHTDLVNRNVAHDLGDALGLGLKEGADADAGPGNQNNASAANDAPDEVLLAGECHGLFGNHPAALNLGQRDLHCASRILNLRVQCAACEECSAAEGLR